MPKIQNSTPNAANFGGFRRNGDGSFPFTMVPNQFLDEVLPHEKTCVVKVVGLILRRTIGWLDVRTGQRRQQEQVAYSEFCREMKMSTQSVAEGLRIALEKGYIVRVKAGSLRGDETGEPEGAWYSLNWESEKQSEAQTSSAPNNTKREATFTNRDSSFQSNKREMTALNSGDMLNTCNSQESKKLELQVNSNFDNYVNAHTRKQKTKFSRYVGNVIRDVSSLFGDSNHELPNIKQALNIWHSAESQLDEKEFAGLVYKARDITRHKVSGVAISAETPANRMPYFFAVLRDLIRQLVPKSVGKPEKKLASSKSRFALKPLHNHKSTGVVTAVQPVAEVVDINLAVEETDIVQVIDTIEVPSDLAGSALSLSCLTPEAVESDTTRMHQETTILQTRYDWIAGYLRNADDVITNWQSLVADITNSQLQKLAGKLLGTAIEQVSVDLVERLPVARSIQSQTVVLFCRNMFDAKQASLYLRELTQLAERVWQRPVQLQPIYF